MLCTYCTFANCFFQKFKKKHLPFSPAVYENSPCFHQLFIKEPALPTKTADQRLTKGTSGMTRNDRDDEDDRQEWYD